MLLTGKLHKYILSSVTVFLYVSGISYASILKGNLEVFFPSEISTISLASVGTFCVARQNADPTALKAGLDWACGPGLVNCGPIQPGQPCYVANNITAIASYAYDAYYQANQATGGTCSFSNTAMLTNTDPSSGSCIFPGSTGSGGGSTGGGGGSGGGSNGTGGSGTPSSPSFAPPSFVPPGTFEPANDDNGVSRLQILKLVYLSALVLLASVML
ncbi:glucan endo-1,3-beta-glucosidase 2-like [Phalaenopsis equestris]|uniref:glucan endo-1,3-beta-glucosidase 2-like n=1 Tax=Phalaenopsis equestris TaxID=78828 RepID=UPI0009E431B7|nr:glucan endo-1,3-beta-glucosidase 2-like [Phalaenopsis equestris]XP_020585167.1 glucan endo-1,3-beta-glucosidase 2-like [Phalaenopsis equestris]XP_020585168.1 glucan endo-1,3-beta-glucosidase 2-like [Phalaenopsis equestris]XP_020585169.1 glucan endo-1,3-beta-glucosidase 2-like [Phalaenopsis equestris]XP_020585170.1 glucan endo-1,3-beta-glucosidase 2-like [Phalaenopsis equestris]XP_020585171.1 glucan endo-1,3-beta-glucosidase 2-like [Phalaenopsis equestris]XP_020585172.1 glucan endo-1,3-beta